MSGAVRRVLREPLLHFAVLGTALFVGYGLASRGKAPSSDRLVVTAGEIENLATTFARTWQRPPTLQELKGLVDDQVRTEVLAREAIALDLDRSDTVIQRRLRQKMEFLAEDLAATAEPTEEELAAFLSEHPEDFRRDSRTSFRQVFLSQERGERLESDARELLARLRAAGDAGDTGDTDELGDRLLLPSTFEDEPRRAIASQFGSDFAQALDALPPGEWYGPLRSGYGLHLVLVTARTEGGPAALDEVRDQVRLRLVAARRERMRDEMLARLLERYDVVVEWPDVVGEAAEASASLR